jgi:hypothetical protein
VRCRDPQDTNVRFLCDRGLLAYSNGWVPGFPRPRHAAQVSVCGGWTRGKSRAYDCAGFFGSSPYFPAPFRGPFFGDALRLLGLGFSGAFGRPVVEARDFFQRLPFVRSHRVGRFDFELELAPYLVDSIGQQAIDMVGHHEIDRARTYAVLGGQPVERRANLRFGVGQVTLQLAECV